jgi:PAS domain S-box-containing protein
MNAGRRARGLLSSLMLGLLTAVMLLTAAAEGSQDNGFAGASTPTVFLQSLTEKERAWLRDHPVIRVVQDPGWPPVEFADEQGEPSGMSADYLSLVEQRLGMKFERVQGLTWQEAYARLKRGEIDMTTSVVVTTERSQFWAFTKPYMKIPIVIATRPDVPYIADIGELGEKRVAVVDGYAANDWIPRDFPDIHLVKVGTVKEGLGLLQRGEVFAFIDSMLAIGYHLAKMKVTSIKIAGQTPYVNAQSMAVRKDWTILAGILDKALDSISETERNHIYKKWAPIRYEHGFDYTLFWQTLAVFVAILLGLAVWIRKLFREIRHRKMAEEALRESEKRLQSTMDGMMEGGQLIGFDWRYLYVNDAAVRHSRRAREELLGKTMMEAYPGIEKTEVFALIRECMEERTQRHVDNQFIYPDESWGWFRLNIQPAPEGVFVLSEDVTEEKRAEEALRYAHERLRRLVDANIVGVVIASPSGRIIEANDYYLHMIGFTREEFEQGGIDWRAITPSEWLPADEKAINELREGGTCAPYEKEYLRRDGARISIFLSDTMFPGPEEEIAAFVLDITERKQAEDALKEIERVKSELLERMNEAQHIAMIGSWEWDLQTDLVWWSDETYRIFGVTPKDYIPGFEANGKFIHPDDFARLRKSFRHSFQTGEPFDTEVRLVAADGLLKHCHGKGKILYDDCGQGIRFIGTIMDVTKIKEAEQEIRTLNRELEQRVADRTAQLEAANKELEAFTYSVSHDLRAPLRAVDGYSRILVEDFGPRLDAEGRRVCAVISDGALKMGRLIDDLLAFSRIGRTEMESLPVDMATLARSIFFELTTAADRDRIDFDLGPLPYAVGDPSLLRQVWMNLLGNAIKFTSKKERAVIEVSAGVQGDETVYLIRDNGAGFDMQYADKLFGVFQRLHSADEFEGTGVGLAITQSIIRRHSGRVWGEGETDKGATFYFAMKAVKGE